MDEHQQNELQTLVQRCAAQARWHQQQYVLLKYYQQYYAYLLRYYAPQNASTFDYGDFDESMHSNHEDEEEEKEELINAETNHNSQQQHDIEDQHESESDHVKGKKRKKKKKKKKKSTKRQHQYHENEKESENESELELDEGFKEFLKQSERFRMERDAMKNQSSSTMLQEEVNEEIDEDVDERLELNPVDVEYVDILHKGPDGTILPPTAQNRKKLYEEKYGAASGTTILSLETALQWKFNKFIDQKTPTMWPAIPLRFT